MFLQTDSQPPWKRDPQFGFRCVKLFGPPKPEVLATLARVARNPLAEPQVTEPVFEAFRRLHAYDPTELNAKVEATDAAGEWVKQRVTFDAAYGGERVTALLFLPRNASPPYQTVVYFPGAWAYFQPAFDPGSDDRVEFLLKSGRALVVPTFKGTYDRRDGLKIGGPETNAPAVWRDHMIAWSRDLGRTLDYLETRPELDGRRPAFLGWSLGAAVGYVVLGVERRIRVAVLLAGGVWAGTSLPEAEPVNFLPRVKTPVLMLNGRLDDRFPMTWSAIPAFRLMGTPVTDKRQVFLDCGHGDLPRKEVIRESLAWLDRYLGPVKPKAGEGK
jgi:dipeptidyl aminopeptidase/acylaminoacyl peptidase